MDIWVREDLSLEWRFKWRRRFFVWEEHLSNNLLEDLEGIVWSNEEDVWEWKLAEGGVFTVKSMYNKLEGILVLENKWGRRIGRSLLKCGKTRLRLKWWPFLGSFS